MNNTQFLHVHRWRVFCAAKDEPSPAAWRYYSTRELAEQDAQTYHTHVQTWDGQVWK